MLKTAAKFKRMKPEQAKQNKSEGILLAYDDDDHHNDVSFAHRMNTQCYTD
jgi:hypothetical protein